MKPAIYTLLILSVALAGAQEPPSSVSVPRFQEFVSPSDERVKVFMEIEAKAETGDLESLAKVGEYYFHGRFPVTQNQVRASEIWTKGASLGSHECANFLAFGVYEQTGNDSERIIERLKWEIIGRNLGSFGFVTVKGSKGPESIRVSIDTGDFSRPEGVSESSFLEAKRRAADFLATMKVSRGGSSQPLSEKGMAPLASFATSEITVPSPSSIRAAQAFRMTLLADYRRIQSSILNRVESASPEEISAYAVIARKIEMVQQKGLGSSTFRSGSLGAQEQLKMAKINELRGQLRAFKIRTMPPFTRQDLNQAQVFLDRYRDLLDTIEKGL